MRSMIGSIAAILTCAAATMAQEPGDFAGDWKTTFGPLHLERDGAKVTGKLLAFNLDVKGAIDGKTLTAGYDEGQVHVDASLEIDPSGISFKGKFQASNGNRGVLNGWRPDPKASQGTPAPFEGLWLTDLGLMELTRDGTNVSGKYALRGVSTLKGTIAGRHLDFEVNAFRKGPGWFDLDGDHLHLKGAAGTDGMPAWYGWNGRKAPEFVRHAPLVAGKIVDGSTGNLLTYSVRAPESYRAGDKTPLPAIVILHGSNMNGKAYVNTIASAWPEIAREYLLLGINGETASNLSEEKPAFNYSYVNYVGRSTLGGFPGTDRESPALVREALAELKTVYPIKHYFVGGHSQGGFLTYSLLMNSPELIAGAFPISAGVIIQCEPSVYADKPLKQAQRAVPLAIVHGKTDPMVGFSGAEYAEGLFRDAGWPAIRLLTDDKAGHMFARLPVDRAIRWLEAMATDDPVKLIEFAETRWKEHARRDAIAAVNRAKTLKPDTATKARLDRLRAEIDQECTPQASRYLAAIRANQNHDWIDGFLAFRDEFEHADAARETVEAYNELRSKQEEPAAKLIGEARGLFRQGKRDEGYAKVKQVTDAYYASPSYRLARKWLAERK